MKDKLYNIHKFTSLYFFVFILTNTFILFYLPTNSIFNPDEVEMSLSVLDRFVGVPSTSLAWPGSLIQMLSTPYVGVKWLLEFDTLSPKSFSSFISKEYRNPFGIILYIRILVTLVFSLGIYHLANTITRGTKWIGVVMSFLLMMTIPEMWRYSHMATGTAASIGLAASAVALGLLRDETRAVGGVAGALFGMAVATKVTILLIGPFALSVSIYTSEEWKKEIIMWGAGGLIGFLIACPYMWTDPVRLGKSIVGNALRPGQPAGIVKASTRALGIVGVPLLVGAIAGIYQHINNKKWIIILGGSISFLSILFSASSSSVLYDRYFLSILIVILYFSCYGLNLILSLTRRLGLYYRRPLALFLVSFLVLYNANSYMEDKILPVKRDAENASELVEATQGMGCKKPLAVSENLSPYFTSIASSTSLRRQEERAWEAREDENFAAFARRRGINPEVIRVLGPAFSEDEQAWIARLSAMSATNGHDIDIVFWGKPLGVNRVGLLDKDEMWKSFREKELCGVVTKEPPSADLNSMKMERFGQYRLTYTSD